MKKTLLAVALASLVPVGAFADVVVYGKANVALQSTDEAELSAANGLQADGSKVELVSNASRIGIKGSEEVNSQLKIIYQFEYQTEVDDGANGSQTFGQRNIFLGLQGSAGTIMGGHFDTPTKVAQEKVDLFNDLEGDLTSIFKGEVRASNIVQYVTPSFGGGFSASVAYATPERDNVTLACNVLTSVECERSEGVSASFSYTSPMFYAAIATDQDVGLDGVDLIRAVARLTLGAFQFGVLGESYEGPSAEYQGNAVELVEIDEDGVLASVLWNMTDKWALKAQYGDSDVRFVDGKTASLGLDYKMTKSATLYGYYTQVENGMPDLATTDRYRDDKYAGIGMDFKF
ncbi:porin [Cellvibrio sp. NN19]|uniref:porin n=1 Tax=Cellvibrio chitinivorans TaxID=3102792 RepID=UPI002B410E51|nr:porin [Cellvibrio sp. NN19]